MLRIPETDGPSRAPAAQTPDVPPAGDQRIDDTFGIRHGVPNGVPRYPLNF